MRDEIFGRSEPGERLRACRRLLGRVEVTVLMLVLVFVADGDTVAGRRPGPIKLGISAAFSGPAKSLGRDMRLGIETGFHRVNRAGGIGGRPLELVSLDDSYVPDGAAENMRRLIDEEEVLAVIGNVGTPTAQVTVPIANQRKILLFGAFTGAGLLRRDPPDRYVINYRASYAQETAAMISGLLDAGIRPYELAFFTQDDSYGDSGHQGALRALRAAGFEDVDDLVHGRYPRNTVDIEDGLLAILNSDVTPRAVIMVGAYVPCAKFIRLARRVLPDTLFLNVSFVGPVALARELGELGEGVVVTQVVPHFESDLPVVREYRRDLEEYAADAEPGFTSLEGYIAARIFVEGLRRAGPAVDREGIVDAIEGLRSLDIGLGVPISYGPSDHQGSDTVWPTVLRNGRYVPLDWADLGRPVTDRQPLPPSARARRGLALGRPSPPGPPSGLRPPEPRTGSARALSRSARR